MTQEVESDEYYFNPGWFSAQEYELYELKDSNIQMAKYLDNIFELYIYADPLKVKSSRAIYNFLGFLGDVGGLFEGLRLITSALIGILSSGGFTKWFVN